MFLKKKKFLLKPRFFFIKRKKTNFAFLGKSYLDSFYVNKNGSFLTNSKTSLGVVSTKTSCAWYKDNVGFFSVFLNKGFSFSFIPLFKSNSVFHYIFDFFKNKKIYNSSKGNYIIFKFLDLKKKTLNFILPSGKQFFTGIFLLGYSGKQLGKYSKYEFSLRFNNGDNKIRVSGVSMNPVDHHNGGRSNRKPLFLNKYNSVAKYGK